MAVFTCINFKGHWPVGAAAVIVAPDADTAAKQLEQTLKELGLRQKVKPEHLEKLNTRKPSVHVLCNGNY